MCNTAHRCTRTELHAYISTECSHTYVPHDKTHAWLTNWNCEVNNEQNVYQCVLALVCVTRREEHI